ncbi:hypothetical protein [Flavobacterium sp. 14A]|uniref:hypothetical protein n=1 Tax=Flavobacterium sp. 14A TaxID=2735896 RepID=UPI0015709518|nr:hypothetical protein [Flavobacterium sp. 14A]NRT11522.1 hypothetical protein [Flavobacterium sp. 14A]
MKKIVLLAMCGLAFSTVSAMSVHKDIFIYEPEAIVDQLNSDFNYQDLILANRYSINNEDQNVLFDVHYTDFNDQYQNVFEQDVFNRCYENKIATDVKTAYLLNIATRLKIASLTRHDPHISKI